MGLELRDMTGRPGHVPYLDAGLVPILEWNTDQKNWNGILDELRGI